MGWVFTHIEFSYNTVVHKTTRICLFEVVYDFNPLTPLDFIPLPNPHECLYKEGVSKAEFIKKLHKEGTKPHKVTNREIHKTKQ